MSKPVLHYNLLSPPSRFARLTATYIGLDIELKTVNLREGEHFTKEYKVLNPTSTVPALLDGQTKIFDSNAIAIYLVEKYAKDDSLYPKNDLDLRTKINERLFWVASFLFPRGYQMFWTVFLGKGVEPSEYALAEFLRGYGTIESFLVGNKYLTGNTLTLCDLSLWCLMESGHQLVPINAEKYPNFVKWLNKMRELSFYATNKEGADLHVVYYRQCLARNHEMMRKKECNHDKTDQ